MECGKVLFGGELIDGFIGAEEECRPEGAGVAAKEVLAHEISFSFCHLVLEEAGG